MKKSVLTFLRFDHMYMYNLAPSQPLLLHVGIVKQIGFFNDYRNVSYVDFRVDYMHLYFPSG